MSRQGSKRVVGMALLASALAMLVAAVLIWGGLLEVGADARPLVSGALIVAAVIDVFVGVRFVQASD